MKKKGKIKHEQLKLEFDFNSDVNLKTNITKEKNKIVSINHFEQKRKNEILKYIINHCKSF